MADSLVAENKRLKEALLWLKEEFTDEDSGEYRGCGYDGCEIELHHVIKKIDVALKGE